MLFDIISSQQLPPVVFVVQKFQTHRGKERGRAQQLSEQQLLQAESDCRRKK